MRLHAKAGAILAIITLQMSCLRLELDGQGDEEVDVGSSALQMTGEDSVVLCPLAASLETSGNVSIVWAGYPAADDRLQLMHARVTSRGALLQEPHGLVLLEDELALLNLRSTGAGIEVHAVARDANELLRIDLSERGQMLTAYKGTIDLADQDEALEVGEGTRCEATVFTASSRLQILRTHEGGELPLFVESFSL
ncbi:MAG: hypothetical protein GY811_20645 [Myxococcales bacterium]|nr:hypothetical protein [Myxococcales bacterium]